MLSKNSHRRKAKYDLTPFPKRPDNEVTTKESFSMVINTSKDIAKALVT